MCRVRVYYCGGDGKFHAEMRKPKIAIALLFAWMLALQGAVAASNCTEFETSHVVAQSAPAAEAHHCVHDSGAVHRPGAGASHQHGCSAHCCGALVASTQAFWAPPRSAAADISAAVIWPSPTVELDRLDRPPRSL
jgi:hypothetical protein